MNMPVQRHCLPALLILAAALLHLSCTTYRARNENPQVLYSTGTQFNTPSILSDTSLVAVGDSVTMSVWGYAEFSSHSLVKSSGTITVPLLGEVQAAGLTKGELSRLLRSKLGEYIQGEIKLSLDISTPVSHIIVLGAVGHQGSFPAISDLSVLEVISMAGGWTPESDLRYVKITRQSTSESDRHFVEIDLTSYLETANLRGLPTVHPGDVVIIPAKENFVGSVGEFFRDGLMIFGVFGLLR